MSDFIKKLFEFNSKQQNPPEQGFNRQEEDDPDLEPAV